MSYGLNVEMHKQVSEKSFSIILNYIKPESAGGPPMIVKIHKVDTLDAENEPPARPKYLTPINFNAPPTRLYTFLEFRGSGGVWKKVMIHF